jgi:hypothetical protein
LWILILGGVGFAAGFLGPIIVNPDANQGPLVGIFIAAPGGAFLGLLFSVVSRIFQISTRHQWQTIWILGSALTIGTLYFCLPGPSLRGYVLDLEIQGCKSPAQATDEAVTYWQKRVAAVTWASPRAGWEEDARRRLLDDHAVVLDVTVVRGDGIYESKKPWNSGRLLAKGWYPAKEQKSFYAQYAGRSCANYPLGSKSLQFVPYDSRIVPSSAENWPPREVPAFLNLQILEPVPPEYQTLVGE